MYPFNKIQYKTGDLFHQTMGARTVNDCELFFEKLQYVVRLTELEARKALRHRYINDLQPTDFDTAEEVVMDDSGTVNLSLSDDEPSEEKFY
jgi:hypothetical protein